jgi:hypothetical protein
MIDVPHLLEACQMEKYKTLKGKTLYGTLNINIEPTELGCSCGERAFDFSWDSNGNISVNVRKWARRRLDLRFNPLTDWKGFLICGKTGKKLRDPVPMKWEPKDKFSMAGHMYDHLVEYLQEGEE